jgi:hypothetical protein
MASQRGLIGVTPGGKPAVDSDSVLTRTRSSQQS